MCLLFLFRHTRSEESTHVATKLHTEENREFRNTATSTGCGVRSHSSFHGSESPNPSRHCCSDSSINCFAFQQTNLGILLVRQAVPQLCSQHCARNTGPRLMLPISTLLQKSVSLSDTSDSRCHLEWSSAQPSPGSPASLSKPSVSRLYKLSVFVPSFSFGLLLECAEA